MVAGIGALYGNLRTENVLVRLSRDLKSVEEVRFINFGYLVSIETVDTMLIIPDQIDHLPPDMTCHLLKLNRFSEESVCYERRG